MGNGGWWPERGRGSYGRARIRDRCCSRQEPTGHTLICSQPISLASHINVVLAPATSEPSSHSASAFHVHGIPSYLHGYRSQRGHYRCYHSPKRDPLRALLRQERPPRFGLHSRNGSSISRGGGESVCMCVRCRVGRLLVDEVVWILPPIIHELGHFRDLFRA